MKRGRPSQVEGDTPPFRTLILLARGVETPKDLSESLGVEASTVVFHLNRLLRAGLIRRGEKDGKHQPYRIDWEGVTRLFIRTVSVDIKLNELREASRTGVQRGTKLPPLDVLAGDPYIQSLVRAGVEEVASRPLPGMGSLKEFFKEFLEMLLKIELDLEGRGPEFEVFKQFIEVIQENAFGTWTHPGSFDWALAMEKLGLVKRYRHPSGGPIRGSVI